MSLEAKILLPHQQEMQVTLRERYLELRAKALKQAEVVDAQTGYIRIPCMNKSPTDLDAIETQADILVRLLNHPPFPSHIIGIPTSGLTLAYAVAERINPDHFVRAIKPDGLNKPDWKDPVYFSYFSFTARREVTICMEPVKQGAHYLVIDDVAAHGNAAMAIFGAIQDRGGIVVGLGVGFDKGFQQGLQNIHRKFPDIPIASVLTIKGLTPNQQHIILE